MVAPFENHCMAYENLLKNVYGCERGKDPEGFADADLFAQGHWKEVALGLVGALEKINRDLLPSQAQAVGRAIVCLKGEEKDNAHFVAALIFTMQAFMTGRENEHGEDVPASAFQSSFSAAEASASKN